MNRRAFTRTASGIVVGSALGSVSTGLHRAEGTASGGSAPFVAVLFDAFPIFDPRSVDGLAEDVFPGRGAELMSTWRARQFEYAWLRVVSRSYADFWRCSEDALSYSASVLGLELTPARSDRLMNAYLNLQAWPDVGPALESLRGAGVRLGLLSNFTTVMLQASSRSAGLQGVFEHVLSTDQVQTYKPDPKAYQLGVDVLGLGREQILFAAFAGWDAAGAKRFGYSTFWVNRLGAPPEQLGVPASDGTGHTLADLVSFIHASR